MTSSSKLRIGVVIGLGASAVAAFIACGGSDDQDVIVPPEDAGTDVVVADNAVPDTGPPDTGPKDSGPQYDAGPAVVLDGGDMYEGGVPCVAGGLIEEEINDEPDAANPVDPAASPCIAPGCSRCGVIFTNDPDAGADGGTELEYVSYTVHPSAKSFYIQFGGEVTLTVRVGAQGPYVINKTASPTIPFVRDQTYFIEVKSNTGKTTPWRVTVFENQ